MARTKNIGLKKANTPTEYTAEQVYELQKCIHDPIYFIRNYVYIKTADGQVKFNLFDYQEEMIHNFQNNRFNINLLPRQVGKTETISAYILWFSMFTPSRTVLITSNNGDNAMEIIAKIQNAYEELPDWLKIGIDENSWNKHECKFDNKSRIVSKATSKNSGRGLTISLVYCDEFAFVPDNIQNEFWTSILPTLSSSTTSKCIISSTPNGDTNKFAELWRTAELETSMDGLSTFHPFTVAWNARPGRDEKFKQTQINLLGSVTLWEQEFECKFISNDHILIDYKKLQEVETSLRGFEPVFTIDKQPFFRRINKNYTYLVGVDPATGSGNDFGTIEVIEFPSMHQVMEYRSNTLSAPDFYKYLRKVLKFLEHHAKEVYFSVENNGVGQAILALYEADEFKPEKATLISEDGKDKLGMVTTEKNKMASCLMLKEAFEKDILKLYSPILIKELKNFKRDKGAYNKKAGSTDDLISGILITLRLLKEVSMYDERAYNLLYKIDKGPEDHGEAWIAEFNKPIVELNDEPMPFIVP